MISQNFSKDVKDLEDWEIYDFDTKEDYETGLNDGRAMLPDRYDIAKHYQHYAETMTNRKGKEVPTGRGRWVKNKNAPSATEGFDWQITYKFPNALHPNVTPSGKRYGGKNVTYRRLYIILCESFNNGSYFIEDYFNYIYPFTMKEVVDEKLKGVKEELLAVFNTMAYTVETNYAENIKQAEEYAKSLGYEGLKYTKSGKLSKIWRRRNALGYSAIESRNAGLESVVSEYQALASSWEESAGVEVASMIKEDIIECLLDSRIPLSHINADSTKAKRQGAGLSAEPEFLAIGNLIESLQLFITLGGDGTWQTQTGIMV